MTALELYHHEFGTDGICPKTNLPLSCPRDNGYLPEPGWCSRGVGHEDCAKCWAREVPDPFIAAALPNYTPVDERKGYCDLGAFRLVIEDGDAVGVYCPGGLEFDAATTTNGDSFVSAICKVAEKAKVSVEEAVTALLKIAGIVPNTEDAG